MYVRDIVMDMKANKLYRVNGIVNKSNVSCITFSKSKADAMQKVSDWYRDNSGLDFRPTETKLIHSGVLEVID